MTVQRSRPQMQGGKPRAYAGAVDQGPSQDQAHEDATGEGADAVSPRPRYLMAASAGISAAAIRTKFAPVDGIEDAEVTVLAGNEAFVAAARAAWPGCTVARPGKGRSSIREVLAAVDRFVLLWDGEDLTRWLFEARLMPTVATKVVPVEVTRVVNKKLTNDFDVYIGRGSPWGNPFAIAHGGEGPDRQEVIDQYRAHFTERLANEPGFKKAVLGLKGLRLACFCKPEACHGDVIVEYLDEVD